MKTFSITFTKSSACRSMSIPATPSWAIPRPGRAWWRLSSVVWGRWWAMSCLCSTAPGRAVPGLSGAGTCSFCPAIPRPGCACRWSPCPGSPRPISPMTIPWTPWPSGDRCPRFTGASGPCKAVRQRGWGTCTPVRWRPRARRRYRTSEGRSCPRAAPPSSSGGSRRPVSAIWRCVPGHRTRNDRVAPGDAHSHRFCLTRPGVGCTS